MGELTHIKEHIGKLIVELEKKVAPNGKNNEKCKSILYKPKNKA